MKKIIALLSFAALTFAPALAHATVRTESGMSESASGQRETYVLNVPVEKDMATTEVRLMVPTGVSLSRFQVTPGFERTVTKNDVGLVSEVIWKGDIAPMEYARFAFQATNPEAAGDLSWKVYQTYADGSVVAWDGVDPKLPASTITIK